MKNSIRIFIAMFFCLSLVSCSSANNYPAGQAISDNLTKTALEETAAPQPSDTLRPSATKTAPKRATITRAPTKTTTKTATFTITPTQTATETGTITLTPTETDTPIPRVKFLLPAKSTTKYKYTSSWGRGNQTTGTSKCTENLSASGSDTDLTVEYSVTSSSSKNCFFPFYFYKVDRVTGTLISTDNYEPMLRGYAGPMPGTTTMTVLGQDLSVYSNDVQITFREGVENQGYWEKEWKYTVYYDAATGIMVFEHSEGKFYYTGKLSNGTKVVHQDYGDWAKEDWEMSENTIPLGQGAQ
jgi:hypothetical protein